MFFLGECDFKNTRHSGNAVVSSFPHKSEIQALSGSSQKICLLDLIFELSCYLFRIPFSFPWPQVAF